VADRDERERAEEPSEPAQARRPPRGLASRGLGPGRHYSAFVGLAFLALIAVAVINAIGTEEGGILGSDPTEAGSALPAFAVPEALGPVEGDANIYQDDCESSEVPCPEDQRRVPACEIDPEGVLRVCDFFDRPLVISFWFTRQAECLPAQDLIDELAQRYRGKINFLSINVRDDRNEVREITEERGWRVPVGHDADGAVSNLYRVGGCPTVALAYPGGILASAIVGGEVTEPSVRERLDKLLRESRRRAMRDR
jgi:hypothetical protein